MDLDQNIAPSSVSMEEALRYAAVFALITLTLLVIGGGLLLAAIAFILGDELWIGLLLGFLASLVVLLGSIALGYKFLVDAVGHGVTATLEASETDSEASEDGEI